MTLPTGTELLRDWDAARPRSRQSEMGISGVGGCRRRAGYQLQGFTQDPDFNPEPDQAILGTLIHDGLAEATRQSVKIPLGAQAESLEVTFAGLKGHPDLYAEPVLRDYKTVGFTSQLERIRANGPRTGDLWQASCYAAALILSGRKVTTIQLNYIARDSAQEYLWEGPFDMQHVRDAVAWLRMVRITPADRLPRDYRPESVICQGCEFFRRCWQGMAVPGRSLRTALFTDQPVALLWVATLEAAREARQAAEKEEEDAKGALDALRTVEHPGEKQDVAIPGYPKVLRFSVERGAERLDRERIEEDYARAGAVPPTTRGAPKIKLTLIAPGDESS
jgi:hypothetical protein